MSDIFISYAAEDRERAKPLAEVLTQQGWSVWWDPKISPGQEWDEVIEQQLEAARCVIVLWSRVSVASKWVKNEAREGNARGILVPILIEETKIPLEFRNIQAANLTGWDPQASRPDLNDLLLALERKLGKPKQRQQGSVPHVEAAPREVVGSKEPDAHAQRQAEMQQQRAREAVETLRQRLHALEKKAAPLRLWVPDAWARAEQCGQEAEVAWQEQRHPDATRLFELALRAYAEAHSVAQDAQTQQQAQEAQAQAEQAERQRQRARAAAEAARERALIAQAEAQGGAAAEIFAEQWAQAQTLLHKADTALSQNHDDTARAEFEKCTALFRQLYDQALVHIEQQQAEQARTYAFGLQRELGDAKGWRLACAKRALARGHRLFESTNYSKARSSYEQAAALFTAWQQSAGQRTTRQAPPRIGVPWTKLYPALALGAIVIGVTVYFTGLVQVSEPEPTPVPTKPGPADPKEVPTNIKQAKEAERAARVSGLLEKAQEAAETGRWTEPQQDNVVEYARQVLVLVPQHLEARQLISDAVKSTVTRAKTSLEKGDVGTAKTLGQVAQTLALDYKVANVDVEGLLSRIAEEQLIAEQKRAEEKRRAAKKQAEQIEQAEREAQIKGIIDKGDRALAANRLTTPLNDNAVKYARDLMQVDSKHPEAQRLVRGVIDGYISLAKQALARGDLGDLKESRESLAKANPVAAEFRLPNQALRGLADQVTEAERVQAERDRAARVQAERAERDRVARARAEQEQAEMESLRQKARTALTAGRLDDAVGYADQMLKNGQTEGDRILKAVVGRHVVLGEAALAKGDMDMARGHELTAGQLVKEYGLADTDLRRLAERITEKEQQPPTPPDTKPSVTEEPTPQQSRPWRPGPRP